MVTRFKITRLEERIVPSSVSCCFCDCSDKSHKSSKKDDCDQAEKGNNGVGNGLDPQPPGNPPVNDGPGTGPGNPGNRRR